MSFISSWHSYGHPMNLLYDSRYLKKKLPGVGFWSKWYVEPSKSKIRLISKNMIIWCLKPFRPAQIDAFPYISRYHTTSRSKVRKLKKKFWIFSFLTIFLTVAFRGLYRRHKMTMSWAFFGKLRLIRNDPNISTMVFWRVVEVHNLCF